MDTPATGTVRDLALRARAAAPAVAAASTVAKDAALRASADQLVRDTAEILAANQLDVDRAVASGTTEQMVDRLRLDGNRLAAMSDGLRQVADLPDPVGTVTAEWTRPNGLMMHKVRVPLGVVAIIYENRPNVTSDAFGLCLKSGNVAFLRGSSGGLSSNLAITRSIRRALPEKGLPADAVILVDDVSREAAVDFMRQRGLVDCLIPRGGPALISSILENATVPYVIDGDGNCHVYVDATANLEMATEIIVNAKMQRPSVCNAAESLVVHRAVASDFLPLAASALKGVELVGDERARRVLPEVGTAVEDDWSTEYLDLKLSIRVVDNLDEAIVHINETGSGHSEAIVTEDRSAADRFTREVDAAAVLVNASTRFVDGDEFGFGAEIGISTQKLHARGPMGLEQLTTEKYVIHGTGQVRA
ncbi:MAG: glutamate-5-semialdehyde dehydrogenase [Actinobacteria bacterium]|jgi:glutamate-5-semialdehyde dehydrogenase|nr:glutamate-5-semialdehyde dehydrogenase [Actinomycetota bacterium]MBT3687814.1 glutamate-5-semialdehyde dehydrogenase [Actinomycetota bacterium]MBT4037076.1 glutamate-5-semialdehyde dehydrogenase [Actinomycetota bacterium]MBT4279325.1 glutamate-5-semialdehyde dehydrogenase [Actinomycetota bacterium]MBT4344223.1 glutamate-5-semialdehyde dehydrogenase [Actinomycetota bacterium]